MARKLDCRAAAAQCLAAIVKGSSLSQQLPATEPLVTEKDHALLRQLCYGVLRLQPRLNAIANQLLRKPFKAKDQDILMLILLGGYQLSETRIPDHAAVAATVGATTALKKPWAKGLVNGVLREWQRKASTLNNHLSLHEQLAHPLWLHQQIQRAWPEHAQAIQEANNQHPPMCIRINTQRTTRDDYQQALTEVEINSQPCEFAPEGLRLHQAVTVNRLPGFFEGLVSVQDEAPQLSAELLELKAGQRVLDICCAPGGKTCHLLEAEPALAEVVALDIDAKRLERVEQNLSRLQLRANLVCADASATDEWWDGNGFDRLLVDAPCSATGVIRRNPDIKLHRNADDIQQLATLQLALLNNVWPTLKTGGLLLYATCSILPDENERLIAQFCAAQDCAEHIAINAPWGEARSFGRQLFPQPNGHDGFYYALIRKKSS